MTISFWILALKSFLTLIIFLVFKAVLLKSVNDIFQILKRNHHKNLIKMRTFNKNIFFGSKQTSPWVQTWVGFRLGFSILMLYTLLGFTPIISYDAFVTDSHSDLEHNLKGGLVYETPISFTRELSIFTWIYVFKNNGLVFRSKYFVTKLYNTTQEHQLSKNQWKYYGIPMSVMQCGREVRKKVDLFIRRGLILNYTLNLNSCLSPEKMEKIGLFLFL